MNASNATSEFDQQPATAHASPPIVLCHPACSGGSIIYRTLVATFSLNGVSEVGHYWLKRVRNFYPHDPVAQMYVQGHAPEENFEQVFWQRICHCLQLSRNNQRQLLIREHTHEYFFDSQHDPPPRGYSWILEMYRQETGQLAHGLVSVRDPVDAWLGLKASFPEHASYDFGEYCRRYSSWLDAIDLARAEGARLHLFRYEDFVRSKNDVVRQISAHLCIPARIDADIDMITSSGNSGRQAKQLTIRPRRPYTTALVRAAESSAYYSKLCQRLGYERLAPLPKGTALLRSARKAALGALLRPARVCASLVRAYGIEE